MDARHVNVSNVGSGFAARVALSTATGLRLGAPAAGQCSPEQTAKLVAPSPQRAKFIASDAGGEPYADRTGDVQLTVADFGNFRS